MAKEKKPILDTDIVTKALEPLAKGLKVAVGELWGIFVRQYVVKGLSEAFTAIVLLGVAFLLKDSIHYWALIPVAVAIYFMYDVINLLGNPKYFALEDLSNRVRNFKDEQ